MKAIDIVYLWVDGSDKTWLAKRNAALAAVGRPVPAYACGDSRFADHGELRYSLRSLARFAPWINHIYIVTDGQRPAWLADSPRVTIVDHRDIVPGKYLPLFNSAAIELFVHHVPGLSEHYLFANDDMFFGTPVSPDFFFDSNGNPIVIVQEKYLGSLWRDNYKTYLAKKGMFFNMVKNGNRIVFERFGLKYNVTMTHAIEPMRKSYCANNVEELADQLMTSTTTPFRDSKNINRLIFPLMDNAKGRNSLVLEWGVGTKRLTYDVESDSLRKELWRTAVWTAVSVLGMKRQDSCEQGSKLVLWWMTPKLFCIGDRKPDTPLFLKSLALMQRMFPDRATWEKAEQEG